MYLTEKSKIGQNYYLDIWKIFNKIKEKSTRNFRKIEVKFTLIGILEKFEVNSYRNFERRLRDIYGYFLKVFFFKGIFDNYIRWYKNRSKKRKNTSKIHSPPEGDDTDEQKRGGKRDKGEIRVRRRGPRYGAGRGGALSSNYRVGPKLGYLDVDGGVSCGEG